jgi:phosphoglucomutase
LSHAPREDADARALSQEIDSAYINAIVAESLVATRSAHIVYSPLHGTGIKSVVPALHKAGFSVTLVDEQAIPDGAFPTVAKNSPNPENVPANDQAKALAEKLGADIAITTDPDADRLGVIARDNEGTYQFLTGNQIAALLGWFVADQLRQQKKLSPKHFFVKTIVTTDFLNAIAEEYGITLYDDLLIGFKYVAELIRVKQDKGTEQFLFGGEESHGILKGSFTRDKDAAIAALLMAELVSSLIDAGHTLPWQLDQLYKKYGVFVETLMSTYYEGASGFATMQQIMQRLRTAPPTALGEYTVVRMIDRATGQHGDKGDVLIFHLSENGRTRITIRPSGTEPKLKVYVQLHEPVATTISDEELVLVKQQTAHKAQELNLAVDVLLKN